VVSGTCNHEVAFRHLRLLAASCSMGFPASPTRAYTSADRTVGSAIVCDRLRLYGNNSLYDRLRLAIYDPRSFPIVCDHMETRLFFFNKCSLSLYVYTQGLLGCLLGFWPLGQNPTGAKIAQRLITFML